MKKIMCEWCKKVIKFHYVEGRWLCERCSKLFPHWSDLIKSDEI